MKKGRRAPNCKALFTQSYRVRRYQNEVAQMVQMHCSAFFCVLRPEDQREGGPSRACSTAVVIARKKNREVAEDSLQSIISEILVIFMRLESSLPALSYQIRLKRVFFPVIPFFWNGLIIIGKMVIVAVSSRSFWEIKFFLSVGWDLSFCLFPKGILHLSRSY